MKYTREFYQHVPKSFEENIRWRLFMDKQGGVSQEWADDIWVMCARDPLFYINTFVFTFDPRKRISSIPFITYEYQDTAIEMVIECIEKGQDCLIEKTRDMGASWIILLVYEWYWKFHPHKSFLIGSRKEDLVDKKDDPDSLFWKIDFIQQYQPSWLVPAFTRKKLSFVNLETKSTIDGESTNTDFGRGGRRTSIMLDEFASVDNGHQILAATSDNSNCRIFNSTPKGVGNAFYDLAHKDGMIKLRMHWSQHPLKARGLYRDAETGKLRSPWYDRECDRRQYPMEIAQELDIDYQGSDYQFFDPGILLDHQKRFCRPPCFTGDIDYDENTCENPKLITLEGGPLNLWINLEAHSMKPPKNRRYAIGVDVAWGTGASNSAASVVDCMSGEKIAEYVHPKILPNKFAKVVVALARFFSGSSEYAGEEGIGAYLIWEANGPGRTFGDCVVELGYRNIYYSKNERRLLKDRSEVPGWWSNVEYKGVLLSQYRKGLMEERFINRSWYAIDECKAYIYGANQSVVHSRSISTVDPSGAKANHADRVIADALAFRGKEETAIGIPAVKQKQAQVGSFAHRRDEWKKTTKAVNAW